jgi:hypothetical protein
MGDSERQKKKKTEDKYIESWGQVGWALWWRHTAASSTSSAFIVYSGKQGSRAAVSGGVTL